VSIDKALFRYDGREEEFTVDEIEHHDDFDLIKMNLYCTFSGCEAKIEYVPKGKYRSYFKTWPKQDHSQNCEDFFEREEKLKREKNSASINIALNNKHISRVLRELYNEANEEPEDRKRRLDSQKKNRQNKKNSVVNNQENFQSIQRTNATTHEGEDNTEGAYRAPSVRKKHNIHLLNEDDIGYTRAVYGIVKSVSITEEKVIIELSNKNKRCNIHFEETFFATSANNILKLFSSLKTLLSNGLEIEFTGIGEIVKRANSIDMIIFDQNHFKLNNNTIFVFSHLNSYSN
jgi:hypothetical protein